MTGTFLQARVSTAGKGKRRAHVRREEERKWGATLVRKGRRTGREKREGRAWKERREGEEGEEE